MFCLAPLLVTLILPPSATQSASEYALLAASHVALATCRAEKQSIRTREVEFQLPSRWKIKEIDPPEMRGKREYTFSLSNDNMVLKGTFIHWSVERAEERGEFRGKRFVSDHGVKGFRFEEEILLDKPTIQWEFNMVGKDGLAILFRLYTDLKNRSHVRREVDLIMKSFRLLKKPTKRKASKPARPV